jgi:hypothetical protein
MSLQAKRRLQPNLVLGHRTRTRTRTETVGIACNASTLHSVPDSANTDRDGNVVNPFAVTS